MKKTLPALLLMEPASQERRRRVSGSVRGSWRPSGPNREEVISRLTGIRTYSAAHVDELLDTLGERVSRFGNISYAVARDAHEVVATIREIAGERPIVTSSSASVDNELREGLFAAGSRVIDSYDERLAATDRDDEGRRAIMASLPFESRFESLEKPKDLRGARVEACRKVCSRDFVGLLGVNAISAADSTLVLLQHTSNISRIFDEASELVLVAGIDKIVANLEDALFQTKCMGVFGADALPLSPVLQRGADAGFEELVARLPLVRANRKIRLIVFDNGRRDLLRSEYRDYFLCIGCRACTAVCPACQSGKPLSPRNLVSNLKKYLPQVGRGLLEGEAVPFPDSTVTSPADGRIEEDAIWACTTCQACTTSCPLGLRHTDAIRALRQNLAMISTSNKSSRAIRDPIRSMELKGHPWAGINLKREEWAQGLDVPTLTDRKRAFDVLYWVGCTPALDERGSRIARATARLLRLAGVEFAILGQNERCCGEPLHQLGNEYLFEMRAQENVSVLKEHGVRKIVTSCPHCYNMLKHEYRRFGGEFEVVHHSEFIDDLVNEGRLRLSPNGGMIEEVLTYHDPCCLGRQNDIYEPPRRLLRAVTHMFREMELCRGKTFCCGGGGGRMWLEENTGQRISEMRVKQSARTGASLIVTACPFCLQMLEDAVKAKEIPLRTMDIVELLDDMVQSAGQLGDQLITMRENETVS